MKFFAVSLIVVAFFSFFPLMNSFAITADEIVKLKKANVSEKTIQMLIAKQDKKVKEGNLNLTTQEIIELKNAGVASSTIQKMLEREEREEIRWTGVTRIKKRADGKEIIVYGSPTKPLCPETKHYYFDTQGNAVLILNTQAEKEEDKAWEMLKNMRLHIPLR